MQLSYLFPYKRSFKSQLLSLFLLLVIILALTTSALTAWQSSKTISEATIENGLQITHNFAEQSVLALVTGSIENANEAVTNTLGFRPIMAVSILNTDGEVLLSSENMSLKNVVSDINALKSISQLVHESDMFWVFSSPVYLQDEQYDDELIEPDNETLQQELIGYVLVEYSKKELHKIQRTIFISNIVTGSIIALILALVMRIIITRMTKPLLAISQTMESARETGLYPKAQVAGALELRQIAHAYNQLMTILEVQNAELAKSRDTLESEVEIRTQELVVARDGALTASRHKSEFLANISHELRTPLQAIIGYTDLVREDLELECMDTQVEDLNRSIRSANTLLALINNILDLAKIEAGRMDLHAKETSIKQLLAETIETVTPMAAANNNTLNMTTGELASTLFVDRQKLMQIFLNLLSNACKFTKNGEITFHIYNDLSFLYFSVQDTGVGIAKDMLDYIFEQFTQVDGSQTRQFEGTGLGMAITQNFCQLMGGQLTVKSEVNVGSTFSVKIPLVWDEHEISDTK
ncbi:HAMP domain-containing sensor histidine kinase [Colwellia sp. RSH04]|uniref:sensor histidine kinase n=1 Tax=Colwellia sp. RSH04 TaxID=2305464 RepID=UPI000E56F09C|nr:ATP-binding protein [Colwellia sp. RSH04]RHW77425.1 HAMP domain-containing protein [Colwellia sp. RSH04]